jgi:hypothetical protein
MGRQEIQAFHIYAARSLRGLHITESTVSASYMFRYQRALVS